MVDRATVPEQDPSIKKLHFRVGPSPGLPGKEGDMRIYPLLFTIFFVTMVAMPAPAVAQQGPGPYGPPSMYRGMPYGHTCPGHGRGPYGARKAVRSADEAKKLVEDYFSSIGKTVSIGRIEEEQIFYYVEILGPGGVLLDKAVIDKRTGRIRSVY